MKFVLFLVVIALIQLIAAEWETFPHYDDQAIAEIRNIFLEEGDEIMTEDQLDAEAETFDSLDAEQQDFIDAMDEISQRELTAIYAAKSCTKTCPSGKKPVSLGKKPTANGCGPEGTSFVTKIFNKALGAIAPASFTACCNLHDHAYGTCAGNSATARATADKNFLSCTTRAVAAMKTKKTKTKTERLATTLSLHKVFYTAVAKFGCSPFKAGQEAACKCA